jgi:hypothetical protein
MNQGRKSKSKKKKKAAAFDQSQPTAGGPPIFTSGFVEVRNSPVHGRGVFARTFIPKSARIIEYLGERLSHKAADDRYEDHDVNDNHTFLFIVDKHTVIDAGVHGNDARFINHQCSGKVRVGHRASPRVHQCDARHRRRRGAGYDYEIGRDKDDPPNVDEIYACRCGSPHAAAPCYGQRKTRGEASHAETAAEAAAVAGSQEPADAVEASRRTPTPSRAISRLIEQLATRGFGIVDEFVDGGNCSLICGRAACHCTPRARCVPAHRRRARAGAKAPEVRGDFISWLAEPTRRRAAVVRQARGAARCAQSRADGGA